MNYTQADVELLKAMHIDLGEPYRPVAMVGTLAQVNEVLTITEVEGRQMRRLNDALLFVERKRVQDEARCEAIRASTRAETVRMAEHEINRRFRAFVKRVVLKTGIAVLWLGAVLFTVWGVTR